MPEPLRVGVIGLGRRWRMSYRPALHALRDRFHIAAVCDPAHDRAARVAQRLSCVACAGPTDLLERPDVEALLLLDPPWYGLWPVGVAHRLGKPVLFCPTTTHIAADSATLFRLAGDGGVPVVPALELRHAPLTTRLRELLRDRLGPACRAISTWAVQGSAASCAAAGSPDLIDLLDWWAVLFDAEPRRVERLAVAGLTTLLVDFGGGRAAQVTHHQTRGCPTPPRHEIVTPRGTALVRPPRTLAWTEAGARHVQRLAVLPGAPARAVLERFHQAATQGEYPGRDLQVVQRLLAHLDVLPTG